MCIRFHDFKMDSSIVAPVIYGERPHQTTNRGVMLAPEVTQELRAFLGHFNAFVGVEKSPYYRIDAYFNPEEGHLTILEINASFVDGWGTALNLARASGIVVDPKHLVFPSQFASPNPVYLPELILFQKELTAVGLQDHRVCALDQTSTDPIYVYGRVGWKETPHIFPFDGVRLDNKLHLARFYKMWDGESVRIPRHYIGGTDAWEEIPQDAVLKFCDKGSEECTRARNSVLFGKPSGKAPLLRRCYAEKKLIAQDFIAPVTHDRQNCQLVILVIGDKPITGYVQYGWSRIVNDNSTHGPLQLL